MPRIHKENSRFRTKEEICADVAAILASSLHYGTKYAVLADIAWVWSEFDGKYHGCKYWSQAAYQVRDNGEKFIHEHVVPKKVIIECLMRLERPVPESVRDILELFCVGVVVTVEEDQRLNKLGLRAKMPEDWDANNPWARYESAGIKVVKSK